MRTVCGVTIRELFLPTQEDNDLEIFFPLWDPGSEKALKRKLLKYLDSDTLYYYYGYEMTASLLSASIIFRVLFLHYIFFYIVEKQCCGSGGGNDGGNFF